MNQVIEKAACLVFPDHEKAFDSETVRGLNAIREQNAEEIFYTYKKMGELVSC